MSAALADALAGAVGSATSAILTFPLDTAKTRVQAAGVGEGSSGDLVSSGSADAEAAKRRRRTLLGSRTLRALVRVYRHEGLAALFRGLDAKVLSALSSGFIYFYAYAFLKAAVRRRWGGKVPVPVALLTAALAGAVNMLCVLPIDNVTTRLQTQSAERASRASSAATASSTAAAPPSPPPPERNIRGVAEGAVAAAATAAGVGTALAALPPGGSEGLGELPPTAAAVGAAEGGAVAARRKSSLAAAVAELHSEGGLPRFWCGLLPSMILTCNPAINYTVFDALKAAYLARWVNARRAPGQQAEYLGPVAAFVLAAAAKAAATLLTYPLIRAKVILMTHTRMYAGCGGQLLHTILKSALLLATREEFARGSAEMVRRLAAVRAAAAVGAPQLTDGGGVPTAAMR